MYVRCLCVLCFLVAGNVAGAQQFHNLNFQQLCDSAATGLCHWGLSWGGKGAVRPAIYGKANCMLLQGSKETSVGFAEQEVAADSSKGICIITASAKIKCDSVAGKGAGLNIGLYNAAGTLIASKDMGGYYSVNWVKGSKSWQTYSISLVAPASISTIKTGAILYGKGKAWFKDYKVEITPVANRQPGKLASRYIAAACTIIQNHSLVKDSVDINAVQAIALKIAGDAKRYSDCYIAVGYLLEALRPYGDEHSFLMTAHEVKNWETGGSQVNKIAYPTGMVTDSCGYLFVPPFHGGNPRQILAYADSMQAVISALYHTGIKGWIVDLRENTGGNMEPMIAGLGPLFSAQKLGSLIDVHKKAESWHYKAGKYFWDDSSTAIRVSHPVYLPRQLPIAVLTAHQTGSSGEAVAISFIGNAKTRFFGKPTWGLTTGNGSFELPDGSKIFLASTIMADRNGLQYYGSIVPDVDIENKPGNNTDPVADAAIQWVKTQ